VCLNVYQCEGSFGACCWLSSFCVDCVCDARDGHLISGLVLCVFIFSRIYYSSSS
jgi:hypothetical protein